MTSITAGGDAWLSDYNVAGTPASGEKDPPKAEGRALFMLIDNSLTSLVDGLLIGNAVAYSTRAGLYADLAHAAGVLGVVYDDTTPAYNGVYVKSGSSGSGAWTITALALPGAFSADFSDLKLRAVKGASGEAGPTLVANALLQGKILFLSADGLTIGGGPSIGTINGVTANDTRTVKAEVGELGPTLAANALLQGKILFLSADGLQVGGGPLIGTIDAVVAHDTRTLKSQDGEAAPLLDPLADVSGFALGLSEDGATVEGAILPLPERTPGPLDSVVALSDENGAAILGVDPIDNSLAPFGGIPSERMARIVTGGLAYMQGVNHRLIFGESGRGVAGGPGFYTTADQIGSPYPLMNIRWSGDFYAATVQESDKWTCEVLTRAAGPGKTAVATASTPLPVWCLLGQSNTGNPGGSVLLDGQIFPHHAMTLGSISASAPYDFTEERLAYLAPAEDTAASPYLGTMVNFALEQFDRDAARRSGGAIVWTSWEGGRDINEFLQGTTNYDNLLNGFSAAVSAAPKWGRTAQAAGVVFVQGESGPYGQSTYEPLLDGLVTDLLADAAPRVLIVQVNVQSHPTHPEYPAFTGVELAQLAVAQDRQADGVTLAGPAYQFPLIDGVHYTPEGRAMCGEMIAAAIDDVSRLGLSRPPFAPTTITRSGATLTLTFPAFFTGLAFDTTWVRALTDKGFVCTAADDGAPLTISSVTIATPTTVQIVLSANPGEIVNVSYAMQNEAGATLGWARGWGQLICPTTRESFAYRRGLTVPQYVNHYCARFSMNSAT